MRRILYVPCLVIILTLLTRLLGPQLETWSSLICQRALDPSFRNTGLVFIKYCLRFRSVLGIALMSLG